MRSLQRKCLWISWCHQLRSPWTQFHRKPFFVAPKPHQVRESFSLRSFPLYSRQHATCSVDISSSCASCVFICGFAPTFSQYSHTHTHYREGLLTKRSGGHRRAADCFGITACFICRCSSWRERSSAHHPYITVQCYHYCTTPEGSIWLYSH